MKTIGFIGTGNMASALIKAVLKAKLFSYKNIISSDKDKKKLNKIKKQTKIATTTDNKEVVQKSDIIFLCVKPQDVGNVLDEIKNNTKNKLIISIAAGIRLKYLEGKLKDRKVVRVMPNTPCLVGEMAAGFAMGKNTNQKDKELVKKILNSAGIAFSLKEELLDVVTGLSGSGPAFFAYIIDVMKEVAVEEGLDEEIALQLAEQTALGTGKLLLEKKLKPKELIDMVSSPKGTTIAGREILEKSDLKEVLKKTIKAAIKRGRELGEK